MCASHERDTRDVIPPDDGGQFHWDEWVEQVECPMAPTRWCWNYDCRRAAVAVLVTGGVVLAGACGPGAERERLARTSKGLYDPQTGQLTAITYDKNGNGTIDTWTRMQGTRPVSSEIDTNEDGVIDRWEEYDEQARLVRAGWTRTGGSAPDTWLYPSPDGRSHRIEFLDTDNAGAQMVTRREWYEAEQKVRVEEDKDGDGVVDQWETWEAGALKYVEFDEGTDGRPDRRFTYTAGALVLIESAPDDAGRYTKRVVPGGK